MHTSLIQCITEKFHSQLDIEVLNKTPLGKLYEQDFWDFVCVDNYEISAERSDGDNDAYSLPKKKIFISVASL